VIHTKQDIQKQLDDAYVALRNLKAREYTDQWQYADFRTKHVLEAHIRYLKSLLRGQS
jgi:hypothetical protein